MSFSKTLTLEKLGLKQEKLTHLHFYYHEVNQGANTTTVKIATTNTSSAYNFGNIHMMDNPLTQGPNLSSKLVGRAQGIYGFESKSEYALLMVMNLVFEEGQYNGSTLSILGRNAILAGVREFPIVGGSGVFRFARGYALTKTYQFDLKKSPNVIEEHDVYVFHY